MKRPKIAIWSLFRDAAGPQIDQYIRQINELDYPKRSLRIYAGESDSRDGTHAELTAWAAKDKRVRVIKHDTGDPYLGHTTDPRRMATLAKTGNVLWDKIAADGWADYALMLESDLVIKPNLIDELLNCPLGDIVAPMIWLPSGGQSRFYDVWAFRTDGRHFPPNGPAWYAAQYQEPFELTSAGSVLLIKAAVLHSGARFGYTDAVVGLCNQAREAGYTIYCDPSIHVVHPIG